MPKSSEVTKELETTVQSPTTKKQSLAILAAQEEDGGGTVVKNWEYKRLSASMLKVWLLCRRKFFEQYVLGNKSAPNTSFSLGTAAHYALELANLALKEEMRELNPIEIEDYVQEFRNMAATLHITDMETFTIGEEAVRQELSNYDLNEKVIAVEQEFDIITPEGVRIYGFIDKLTEKDSQTIKITDYKTSKNPISYEDAKADEQLSMYDLAVSIMFPQYSRRELELKYLRTGDSIVVDRTDIEQQNFRRQLVAIDLAIKDYMSTLDRSVKPEGQLNQFCNWCDHKRSCESYIEVQNTTLPGFPALETITDDTFIEMWEKVSSISKAAELWQDNLKHWAAQRMEQDSMAKITNGIKEVYTPSSTRREYDVKTIGKLIGLNDLLGASTGGVPLVKITNKSIEQYLKVKNNRKLQARVEQAVNIKYNSPQIRIKKSKN